ncbi:hypothetical protein JG688_00016568, partial [Phytophthora aleatoria]
QTTTKKAGNEKLASLPIHSTQATHVHSEGEASRRPTRSRCRRGGSCEDPGVSSQQRVQLAQAGGEAAGLQGAQNVQDAQGPRAEGV